MQEDSARLGARTARATVLFIVFLAILIFVTAGTLNYWQGWLYLANFTFWIAVTGWYVVTYDPALAARRMRSGPTAETEPAQKRIQAFNSVVMIALYLVSCLDYRFSWSSVPTAIVILGNIFTALGFIGCLIVFRQNSYAAATVGVQAGQTVVSDGLYGIVRHPMYSAALLLFAGTPLALGSYWGLLPVLFIVGGLVARLLDEEKHLRLNLAGYAAYCEKVRYRLIPLLY
ncbi:isoprenylcysteine carboxylmethyltransferase family protein [Rhizobium sp. LC145]|uniref:methyltransferase family protein n=1 Tax=Rhizobium sp. LC145 TaxID=1120688 RepID=UPI00069A1986|nr:isoprenylcysteine carboxylmethyltransferase family protein [Rhizobium sp. LC145]TKT55338.1 isoprenylcysteine carboxylmethyltransferase family protein [Rhizobiaceae bacterium LC148]